MEHKKKDFSLSWFFRWFLDNKAITVFLVTLLLGLNIFVLSKISFIFISVSLISFRLSAKEMISFFAFSVSSSSL